MGDSPPTPGGLLPQRFRKKPVVIEAVQYHEGQPLPEGVCGCRLFGAPRNEYELVDRGPHVHTLEGPLLVSPGDWIVRGVKGEFYPVKDDIFAATYEAVE